MIIDVFLTETITQLLGLYIDSRVDTLDILTRGLLGTPYQTGYYHGMLILYHDQIKYFKNTHK